MQRQLHPEEQAFFDAIKRGDFDNVQKSVQIIESLEQASLHVLNDKGESCFLYALRKKQFYIASFLMHYFVQKKEQDSLWVINNHGNTALHFAVQFTDSAILKKLLDLMSDWSSNKKHLFINALDLNEKSSLHKACRFLKPFYSSTSNLKDLLLQAGAEHLFNLNSHHDNQDHPVLLLLEHGALPTIRNRNGCFPIEFIFLNEKKYILECMLSHPTWRYLLDNELFDFYLFYSLGKIGRNAIIKTILQLGWHPHHYSLTQSSCEALVKSLTSIQELPSEFYKQCLQVIISLAEYGGLIGALFPSVSLNSLFKMLPQDNTNKLLFIGAHFKDRPLTHDDCHTENILIDLEECLQHVSWLAENKQLHDNEQKFKAIVIRCQHLIESKQELSPEMHVFCNSVIKVQSSLKDKIIRSLNSPVFFKRVKKSSDFNKIVLPNDLLEQLPQLKFLKPYQGFLDQNSLEVRDPGLQAGLEFGRGADSFQTYSSEGNIIAPTLWQFEYLNKKYNRLITELMSSLKKYSKEEQEKNKKILVFREKHNNDVSFYKYLLILDTFFAAIEFFDLIRTHSILTIITEHCFSLITLTLLLVMYPLFKYPPKFMPLYNKMHRTEKDLTEAKEKFENLINNVVLKLQNFSALLPTKLQQHINDHLIMKIETLILSKMNIEESMKKIMTLLKREKIAFSNKLLIHYTKPSKIFAKKSTVSNEFELNYNDSYQELGRKKY